MFVDGIIVCLFVGGIVIYVKVGDVLGYFIFDGVICYVKIMVSGFDVLFVKFGVKVWI